MNWEKVDHLASTGLAEESSLSISSSYETLENSSTGMDPLAKLSSSTTEVVCLHVLTERRVRQRATAEVVHKGDQS